ncbi:hypothetical protein Cgig2_025480 [Carnegiea gigantea]|uniref:Uncharacterized protein n=1 Tax=Carnegiea gigantea TaxID=171969 RepID=A0A9Q1QEW5_9CARY|nr:hypothetical protein Cgig2_025480 [Carnegiea gigantea]
MEVTSNPFLMLGRLPIGILDRLPFIPIGKVPPTCLTAYEEKIIFSVLNLGLLLNSRYETLLVVKRMPPKVPSLLRGPLDRMGLRKCTGCAGGGLFTVASALGSTNLYPTGKRGDGAGGDIITRPMGTRRGARVTFRGFQQLVRTPQPGRRLGLGHASFLDIRNLFLKTKNAGGGGILATRPRGCAGLKYGHRIGNLFGLPKLILWGYVCYHPAIN